MQNDKLLIGRAHVRASRIACDAPKYSSLQYSVATRQHNLAPVARPLCPANKKWNDAEPSFPQQCMHLIIINFKYTWC